MSVIGPLLINMTIINLQCYLKWSSPDIAMRIKRIPLVDALLSMSYCATSEHQLYFYRIQAHSDYHEADLNIISFYHMITYIPCKAFIIMRTSTWPMISLFVENIG